MSDTPWNGRERRSRPPTLRQSFRANPALAILLAFNVLMTGLIVTSLKAERDFERRERVETERDLQRTGEVLLYFCEQIETHRYVSHQFFVASAAEQGLDVSELSELPSNLKAPKSLEESQRRCDRFKPPAEERDAP